MPFAGTAAGTILGAAATGAAVGAVSSAAIYTGVTLATGGTWSLEGMAQATAIGALIGGVTAGAGKAIQLWRAGELFAEDAAAAADGGLTPAGAARGVQEETLNAEQQLGERLGEDYMSSVEVRVGSENPREFDVISRSFVGQTTSSENALLNPENFLSQANRAKIQASLSFAQMTGRIGVFEFTNGVSDEVVNYIAYKAFELGGVPFWIL